MIFRALLPLILLAGAALTVLPQDAAAQGNAAMQRQIDEAVRAHLRRQAAEDLADRNNRVAARYEALANAPGSPVLGNPRGDVTIVAFFDYACPYCRVVEPRLMELVRRDGRHPAGDEGVSHPDAPVAHRRAHGAGGGAPGKVRSVPPHPDADAGSAQCRRHGSGGAFPAPGSGPPAARHDGPDVNDELIANFNLARGIRAFQTPTFIVGRRLVTDDSERIDFAREVAAARRSR